MQEENIIKKPRINLFDNSRMLLMYLVVFAHVLELYVGKSITNQYVYSFIYLFHMPVFVFISGYFYKKENIDIKIVRNFSIYCVFQILFIIIEKYWLKTVPNLSVTMFIPVWILWYTFCIIIWSFISFFINIKNKKVLYSVFGISIILALIVGNFKSINTYLSLSRFFVFYPYFLFGIILKNHFDILKIRENLSNKKVKKIIVLCILFFIIGLISFALYKNLGNIKMNYFYESKPYKNNYNFVFRLIHYIAGFTFIELFVLFMTNKKIPIITDIGKNTEVIYLLHVIFINLLEYFNFKKLINGEKYGIIFSIGSAIVIVVLLYLVSKLKNNIMIKIKEKKNNKLQKGEKTNG